MEKNPKKRKREDDTVDQEHLKKKLKESEEQLNDFIAECMDIPLPKSIEKEIPLPEPIIKPTTLGAEVSQKSKPPTVILKVGGCPKGRNWFITWNNHTENSIKELTAMAHLTKYAIQEETGKDGTKHLQGVLCFTSEKSFKFMKEKLPHCHLELCRNIGAAKNYCTKIETRTGKQWVKGFKSYKVNEGIQVIDPLDGKELYKWQKAVIKTIKGEPHDRTIYWIWSEMGKTGKTSLCKHLVLKHKAIVLGGKFGDAHYAIAKMVNEQKKNPTTIVFDIPRSQGNKISYTAIENVKNGLFFSSKYESQQVVFNPPHVIIFANSEPDKSKLSSDRWKILNVDNLNFSK